MDAFGYPVTEFIDIVAIESANAVGVLNGVMEALRGLDLTDDELKSKLIGCTFDGASVNQGAKGGVIVKLQDIIPHVLVSIWCAPHKLELSLLDTTKQKDPSGQIVIVAEKGIDPIFRFYYASPKRRRELNEIADLIEEDPVYFSAPCGTRWMASRLRAYRAVLKHYPAVVMHLEQASHKKNEEGSRCVGYLKCLRTRKFIDAISFLIDVLCILSDVSLAFQKEELMVTDVVIKLTEAILKLTQMKTNKGNTYSGTQMCISGNEYERSGNKLALVGDPFKEEDLNIFLDSAIKHINKRFEHMRQSPFKDFEIFDSRNHPYSDISMAAYGWEEIEHLLDFFKSVLSEQEVGHIPHEWPAFIAVVKSQIRVKTAHELLSDLLASNPENMQNLLVLARLMVTLSPSSASVERGFSQMKSIKSSRRARMNNETLCALMQISHMKTSVKDFNPVPTIQHWMTSKTRARHIKPLCGTAAAETKKVEPQPVQQTNPAAPQHPAPRPDANDEAAVALLPDMPRDSDTSSDEEFLGFWFLSQCQWTEPIISNS